MGGGTTLKLGWTDPLTGAFGAHPSLGGPLDLNDGASYTLVSPEGLELPPPPRTLVPVGNIRTRGERATRAIYRHNRQARAQLLLGPLSTGAELTAALRTLLAWVNAAPTVPVTLQYQPPSATASVYLDVVGMAVDVPSEEDEWLALQLAPVTLLFWARPGLRGERVTLSNLVMNPGFEAPSGPGVTVFSDPLATFGAYTVQAGGALSQDATTYADVVLQDSPLRYYRLDEASGTVAVDASPQLQNGTYNASGVSYAQAGALTGDADAAVSLDGVNGRVVVPTSGLPSGAGASGTVEAWVKVSAYPGGNAIIAGWGSGTTKTALLVYLSSTGGIVAGTNGGDTTASAPVTKNAWHHVAATWDGTTLMCWVDGAQTATATPAGVVLATAGAAIGVYPGNTTFPFAGVVDEVAFYGTALSSARIGAHATAGTHAPTANAANTLSIPAGGRVAFGSPAWGDINTWQARMRMASGLTATWYLHYTDANNALALTLSSTQAQLVHTVGGVQNTLATQALALVPGIRYWVRVTQFPTVPGNPAMVRAVVLADANGSPGGQIASVGPVGTTDAVTALMGAPQLAASGAALALSGAHTLSLFRPGGWRFSGQAGAATGLASGAVDGTTTLLVGPTTAPVASAFAARTDCAPVGSGGTTDARWSLYGGGLTSGLPTDLGAMPVAAPGDTLGLSAWVKTTANLGASATLSLLVTEYDASGAQLRQATAASLTGPQPTWTKLAASYVTGAGCVWVDLGLRVLDATSGSAGATVWWENAQVWDQTSTGMATMPYGELRFPQSPAQLLLTGLEGDLPAPAALGLGTKLTSWPQGSSLSLLVGRRGQVSANAKLVGAAVNYSGAGAVSTPTLDASAYHGYTLGATVTSGGWNPRGFSAAPGELLGTYHLWNRFQSAQALGNLGNVLQRSGTFLQSDAWIGASDGSDLLGAAYGTWAAPLSSSATWTLCDAGQVVVPPFPLGAWQDPAQNYVTPRPQVEDLTAGGSACAMNWELLLPVDGSLVAGVVNNPTNNPFAVANRWLWVYADGLLTNRAAIGGGGDGPAWGWSLESGPQANPAHAAGGYGTQASGQINVNLGAEPYLTLDPSLVVNGSGAKVNQLAAVVADQAGAVLPLCCEVVYTPLYLEPR